MSFSEERAVTVEWDIRYAEEWVDISISIGQSCISEFLRVVAGTEHEQARHIKGLVAISTDPETSALTVRATDDAVAAGISIVLVGTIQGRDVFPCCPGMPADQMPMIRAVSGLSHNRLNTGVYCRSGDWAIEFDADGKLDILPGRGNRQSEMQDCAVAFLGRQVTIRVIADFFRVRRGLEFFRPDYELPEHVPAGWISWKAYEGHVTERNIRDAADWVAENLRDYGLEYVTIDDGWFVGSTPQLTRVPPGVDWTKANAQFPGGMKAVVDYIHERGLKAGIWLSPFGCSVADAEKMPDWWLHAGAGGPVFQSNPYWHGPVFVDASNPEGVENWLLRGVRAQLANGFDYLKIDGQMHTAYDGYSKTGDYFEGKGTTWQAALRQGWAAIRSAVDEAGAYVLSCWSRVPEIVGLPHAIRIGADKISAWKAIRAVAEDLGKWYCEHNIAWCDDPDHLCLVDLTPAQCRTWATMAGLTGTHLTFSDKPEAYAGEKLEIMRRILPVVTRPATRPLNLFQTGPAAIWTLEIDRPFDRWLVVANSSAGEPVETLDFAALGLDPAGAYAAYDFWNRRYLGVHTGCLRCGRPGEFDTQVFGLRAVRPHPWVVATNRHISMGAVDLLAVAWDAETNTLAGRSAVVVGDPYVVTIHVPAGWRAAAAGIGGRSVEAKPIAGDAVEVAFTPEATGEVEWRAEFEFQQG